MGQFSIHCVATPIQTPMTIPKPKAPAQVKSPLPDPASRLAPRPEYLAALVLLVRGEKVLLDTDLASLYGVEARALNQADARNRDRFPQDFMF
jgi:ORF6N domain